MTAIGQSGPDSARATSSGGASDGSGVVQPVSTDPAATDTVVPDHLSSRLLVRLGNRYLLSSILLGMDMGLIGEMLGLGKGLVAAWSVVYLLGIVMTIFGRTRLKRAKGAENRLRWSDWTILAMAIMAASLVSQILPFAGPYLIMTSTASTVAYIVFAWNRPTGWPLRESNPPQEPAL